jgi:hypothetical protein
MNQNVDSITAQVLHQSVVKSGDALQEANSTQTVSDNEAIEKPAFEAQQIVKADDQPEIKVGSIPLPWSDSEMQELLHIMQRLDPTQSKSGEEFWNGITNQLTNQRTVSEVCCLLFGLMSGTKLSNTERGLVDLLNRLKGKPTTQQ